MDHDEAMVQRLSWHIWSLLEGNKLVTQSNCLVAHDETSPGIWCLIGMTSQIPSRPFAGHADHVVFFCGEMLSRPACKVGPRASSSTGVYGEDLVGHLLFKPIERAHKPGNWMYFAWFSVDFRWISEPFNGPPSEDFSFWADWNVFHRMTSGQFCPILIGMTLSQRSGFWIYWLARWSRAVAIWFAGACREQSYLLLRLGFLQCGRVKQFRQWSRCSAQEQVIPQQLVFFRLCLMHAVI